MPVYLFNTLTRRKEEFKPQNPPEVKIYTCGVTVYDECHIGHARSLYVFNVIRRYLEYRGFKVNFVRNITDIDDKIINRASELNKDWVELIKEQMDSYKKDLDLLGIRPGLLDDESEEPRATKNIPDMIKYIEELVNKGFAYITGSGVYFSVRKFKDYGKLSGQSVDQMLAGARIEPDETKQDPLDFALWKISKPGEPSWDSPWGRGRPGWHIECSVMSQKFLRSDTLDIHAGGRDLIFPHHENEIAQSEAKTGRQFAKYWLHHGLLTINGQKMAKSLGNFVTIKDFIEQHHDADILKLFFLSTHYSNPIDYNKDKIEEFRKQKKSFDDFLDSVNNWLKITPATASSEQDMAKVDDICARFHKAMDDDFNTPIALACLFELIDSASVFVSSDKEEAFNYAKSRLETFLGIFGIATKPKEELPPKMVEMMKKRSEARANKDFRTADVIRNDIQKIFDYLISDTDSSVTAKRK